MTQDLANAGRPGSLAAPGGRPGVARGTRPSHDVPRIMDRIAVALRRGDRQAAVRQIEKGLRIARGNSPSLCNNLGEMLRSLGLWRKAAEAFAHVLELRPDAVAAHNNLASVLRSQGRFRQAEEAYRRAIALMPKEGMLYCNLGHLLKSLDRLDEAAEQYRAALAADPRNHAALVGLYEVAAAQCDWETMAAVAAPLDRATEYALRRGKTPRETPFAHICRKADPARNGLVAQAWARQYEQAPRTVRLPPRGAARSSGPIVVGYLSADFRDHPTAHLIRSLFAAHDRSAVRVHVYSAGPDDGNSYRADIARSADRFADISHMPEMAAARRIAADGVDILVDLMGHTRGNRLGVLAMRPAPVQVAYLGFPGSTGARFIDYLVADRVVLPPQHAAFCTERPIWMPDCYQVNDSAQPVAEAPGRDAAGLPPDGFVFCCFSQHYKYDPETFACWMRILRAVPGSVLWLAGGLPYAERRLRQAAEQHRIPGKRLIFAPRIPKPEHLARLALADVALDTLTVNGHTTTSDALWAGVPVITTLGGHFASRVSASLLGAVGVGELAVPTLQAYEDIATALARTPRRLASLRSRLETGRSAAPLFNTARFARHLEAAYRTIWKRHCMGLPPGPVAVDRIAWHSVPSGQAARFGR
jgi:protein O-GlcNAc transferase